MKSFIYTIAAALCLTSADAQSVGLSSSSVGDRFFVASEAGTLSERRFQAGAWVWVAHPLLNAALGQNGVGDIVSVGPLLCASGICRLYVVEADGVLEYNYEQALAAPGTSPNVTSTSGGTTLSYERVFELDWDCQSNIVTDSQWRLHCVDADGTAYKYDLDRFEHEKRALGATKSLQLSDRPAAVAYFDGDNLAYNISERLHISSGDSPTTVVKEHPGTRGHLTSVGGDGNEAVFAMVGEGSGSRLFKVEHTGSRYDWKRVSKPPYMRRFDARQRMVRIGDRKWAFLAQYKRPGGTFVAERWFDAQGGDWHWADHGFPAAGQPRELFDPYFEDSSFFVITQNDRLVQRTYVGSGWVWSDHGLIP